MDRRTILAVVLSTIVVLVFYTFIIPQPERNDRAGVADSTAVGGEPLVSTPRLEPGAGTAELDTPPSNLGQTADPVSSPTSLGDSAANEELVTYENDLYEATFSSRGGELVSWTLKEYNNPGGNPVEMVMPGSRELGIVIVGERELDLSQVMFSAQSMDRSDGTKEIVFEAGNENSMVRKTYILEPNTYRARLNIELAGFPEENNYRIGWTDPVPRAEKNPKQDRDALGAVMLMGKDKETVKPKDFKNESRKEFEGNVRWAGVRNKYFAALVVPPEESSTRVLVSGSHEPADVGAEIILPLLQGRANHSFGLFVGPMEYNRLKASDDLQASVDWGWSLFKPISKLLLATMLWMYQFIPNYGWVIIIISLLTKLIFYPLTKTSLKSMRAMQKLQPEMTALREKYKGDQQELQKQTMALYKKHKVNPVGGCLPMLIQMPVFIALYAVLGNSIAMRNAPFVGWINDLSSPDTLFSVAGFAIHILPIILFIFTVLQQKMTPTNADPRQKMMGYMMPFVTLFIFYGFPAGLNLYWTVNSVATVAQQWLIHRDDPMPAAPAVSTT